MQPPSQLYKSEVIIMNSVPCIATTKGIQIDVPYREKCTNMTVKMDDIRGTNRIITSYQNGSQQGLS